MASIVQIVGSALIVLGISLLSIPAGVIAAGAIAVVIGIALERD